MCANNQIDLNFYPNLFPKSYTLRTWDVSIRWFGNVISATLRPSRGRIRGARGLEDTALNREKIPQTVGLERESHSKCPWTIWAVLIDGGFRVAGNGWPAIFFRPKWRGFRVVSTRWGWWANQTSYLSWGLVNSGEGEKGKSLVNVGFVWVCWWISRWWKKLPQPG